MQADRKEPGTRHLPGAQCRGHQAHRGGTRQREAAVQVGQDAEPHHPEVSRPRA